MEGIGTLGKDGNKLSLIDSDGFAFSRMNLDYVVDSPEASHLADKNIIGGESFILESFSYDYYKFIDYFNVD